MSDGLNDSLNLSGFLAIPPGVVPDPAKKACAHSPNITSQRGHL